MIKKITLTIAAAFTLSACAKTPIEDVSSNPADAGPPPELIGLAAANQDLSTARIRPEDRCYWYEHRGRVEATLLPVLSPSGQRICLPPLA